MRRLVVAIDYGTSNSGVAYVLIDDSDKESDWTDDVQVIKKWPHSGASRDASEKVPSDVSYDSSGHAVGHGFEIPHSTQPLQWVKLLLEPDTLEERSARTSRIWQSYDIMTSQVLSKSPIDVVADYLAWLWTRTCEHIKNNEDEDNDLFEPSRLSVIMTVPASWSARAKQSLAKAAAAAGIPEQSLKLLVEAEAAAIFGLKRQAKKRAVSSGDSVIIVDAGGGTVDLVAYQVRERSPLELDQKTDSKGDFCGSAFVNSGFTHQLRFILGSDYDLLNDESKFRIEDDFEYKIKRTYDWHPDGRSPTYYLPVPALADDESRSISNGEMRIDNAILKNAFEPVFKQVVTLIDHQMGELQKIGLRQTLKGILLVGGFSQSPYLHSRIRDEYSKRENLKIWRVDDAWTAVVRGAASSGASGLTEQAVIHSRLSAFNYGIPHLDRGKRKVKWLVKRGQTVQSSMSTEPYGLRIDDQPWLDEDEYCLVHVPLVSSKEENASDDHTPNVTPLADIVCRIPTKLRFSANAVEVQQKPHRVWHIPATLVLFLDGAVISFRCRIENKDVGVADVTYFKDGADYIDEEDLRNSSEPSLHSALAEVRSRVDSKVSSEGLLNKPSSIAGKDSVAMSRPSSVFSKSFFSIRTRRDSGSKAPWMGPSYAADPQMPGFYSRGWIARVDAKTADGAISRKLDYQNLQARIKLTNVFVDDIVHRLDLAPKTMTTGDTTHLQFALEKLLAIFCLAIAPLTDSGVIKDLASTLSVERQRIIREFLMKRTLVRRRIAGDQKIKNSKPGKFSLDLKRDSHSPSLNDAEHDGSEKPGERLPAVNGAFPSDSIPDLNLVTSGFEYQWLLGRFQSTLEMTSNRNATNHSVQSVVARELDAYSPEQAACTAQFQMDWDPLPFLESANGNMQAQLDDVVVLTSSGSQTQATNCSQYLAKAWPSTGKATLRTLQAAINHRFAGNQTYHLLNGGVTYRIRNKKLVATIMASKLTVFDFAEQLCWLGSACRIANDVRFIQSQIQPGEKVPLDNEVKKEEIAKEEEIACFKIKFMDVTKLLLAESDLATGSWGLMFRNPNIAVTYPIILRPRHEKGPEVSMDAMVKLTGAGDITTSEGQVMIKGPSSVFVPTWQTGSSITWHFCGTPDRARMSSAWVRKHLRGATLVGVSRERLEQSRHFVGWATPASDPIQPDLLRSADAVELPVA